MSQNKKSWVTEIKAEDPNDGHVKVWCGPRVEAPTMALAQRWCSENGLGYCEVVGEFIAEYSDEGMAQIIKKKLKMNKAAVCVIYDVLSKEILMLKRNHAPLGWGLVGGKVDEGETYVEACIREVKEESGIDIDSPIYLDKTPSATGDYEMIIFKQLIKGRPKVVLSDEHEAYSWVDPKNPHVELAGNTQKMLDIFNTYND